MDLDYGSQYNVVFPYALALFHNLSYHQKRNTKSEMDCGFRFGAHTHGNDSVLFIYHSCTPICIKASAAAICSWWSRLIHNSSVLSVCWSNGNIQTVIMERYHFPQDICS